MYELPGEVLKSPEKPTQDLDTGMKAAEALDSYVQPRFNILRDKNFGAFRIVYKRHAGIVQLKVESPAEKRIIANVNATKRDYAIGLLHCPPEWSEPKLQLLYFNQEAVVTDTEYDPTDSVDIAAKRHLDWSAVEKKSVGALPTLLKGQEFRTRSGDWDVLMRPVPASKQECLGCHEGSKPNSVLGVMVYAVGKKPSEATRIGLR